MLVRRYFTYLFFLSAIDDLKFRLTERAFNTKNNPQTDIDNETSDENIIDFDEYADNQQSEIINLSLQSKKNLNLTWKVHDFDINDINLNELKSFFSDHAIFMALKKHLKDHGPNKLAGVKYKQSI